MAYCTALTDEASYKSAKYRFVGLLLFMSIIAIGFRLSNGDPFHGKAAILSKGCGNAEGRCESYQAVFRVSFASFLFFIVMMFSCSVCSVLHRRFWALKLISLIGLIIVFFFVDNDVFNGYKELARVLSGIYLFFQVVILINLAYSIHDSMLGKIDQYEQKKDEDMMGCWKYGYIFVCLLFLSCTIIGIALLYTYFGDCRLNIGFITSTLILSFFCITLSLLEKAGVGLLPPVLVSAYCTYLCWQALMSHPSSECNPAASNNDKLTNWSIILSLITTAVTLVWTGYSTSRALIDMSIPEEKHDQPKMSNRLKKILETGEDTQEKDIELSEKKKSGSANQVDESFDPHSELLWVFHGIMVLASAYMAMVLTNWGSSSGDSISNSPSIGTVSMYLKIASQWLTFALFLATIVLPLIRGQ